MNEKQFIEKFRNVTTAEFTDIDMVHIHQYGLEKAANLFFGWLEMNVVREKINAENEQRRICSSLEERIADLQEELEATRMEMEAAILQHLKELGREIGVEAKYYREVDFAEAESITEGLVWLLAEIVEQKYVRKDTETLRAEKESLLERIDEINELLNQ
jgi:hypothetical protein